MSYRTARRIAVMVQRGHAYLYTDRDLVAAIREMEGSSLYAKGLPTFDSDLEALYDELDNRKQEP